MTIDWNIACVIMAIYEPDLPNIPSPGIVYSRHSVLTVLIFLAWPCIPVGGILYA